MTLRLVKGAPALPQEKWEDFRIYPVLVTDSLKSAFDQRAQTLAQQRKRIKREATKGRQSRADRFPPSWLPKAHWRLTKVNDKLNFLPLRIMVFVYSGILGNEKVWFGMNVSNPVYVWPTTGASSFKRVRISLAIYRTTEKACSSMVHTLYIRIGLLNGAGYPILIQGNRHDWTVWGRIVPFIEKYRAICTRRRNRQI